MRVHLAAGLLAIAATGGCYATTGVGYSAGYVAPAPVYTTSATVSADTYEPDLVDVGGGVQVIADYDEPVFYTDNFYWRFYGGTWYRSSVYNSGWTVYNDVPYSVRRIDRPHAYVRYRPAGYTPRARRDPYVRDNRGGYDNRRYEQPSSGPAVRDHRTNDNRGGYDNRRYEQPAPAPVVRDHRTNDNRGYDNRAYDRPAPAPVVRDHRTDPAPSRDNRPAPAPSRDYRPAPAAPAPATRDHREERRDDRRDSRPTNTRDHRR